MEYIVATVLTGPAIVLWYLRFTESAHLVGNAIIASWSMKQLVKSATISTLAIHSKHLRLGSANIAMIRSL